MSIINSSLLNTLSVVRVVEVTNNRWGVVVSAGAVEDNEDS